MSDQAQNMAMAGIFSNARFEQVLVEGENARLDRILIRYGSGQNKVSEERNKLLDNVYRYLLSEYRCEYIYKNLIARKILLGRHSLNTSVMINEFKVGSSLADAVIFNGYPTVYEIKTELDSPERLEEQLNQYYKAFTTVYLVVHHSQADRYLQRLRGSNAGLLALTRRNQFTTIRKTNPEYSGLDIKTMFKCLRKQEYSNIITRKFRKLPQVHNMRYFKACLKLAQTMEPLEFHRQMNNELKKRKPQEPGLITSRQVPESLTNICLSLNPSTKQYERLISYLNQPIS